jgi:hypothetical protein
LVDQSVFVWNLEDSDSDEPLIVLDGMGEIRDPALSTGGKVLLKNSQLVHASGHGRCGPVLMCLHLNRA